MIDVGRLCVKIAGRDAGKKCVVVSVLDSKFVLIDGETRRRKCNLIHLEPLDKNLDMKENASHDEVVSMFKKIGIELVKHKSRKSTVRPRTLRRSKLAKKTAEKKTTAEVEKKHSPKTEVKNVEEQSKFSSSE